MQLTKFESIISRVIRCKVLSQINFVGKQLQSLSMNVDSAPVLLESSFHGFKIFGKKDLSWFLKEAKDITFFLFFYINVIVLL